MDAIDPRSDTFRKANTIEDMLLVIDDRTGSLEKGKDADLVLFNGDPFMYTSQITRVIINDIVQ